MSIIAVSEEVFSGGREFAEGLAKRLGVRYVDSAVLVERAAAWGGQPKRLRAAFEHAPSLLDRFVRGRERQVLLLQAALAEDIRDGNAVCYGVAADLLNVDCQQILRIRVQASHRARCLRVEERLRFNRVEAERYLHKSDRKRCRWQMYLYGGKAGLPLGHDLLLNLEQTSLEENYATISDMIAYQGRFRANVAHQALLKSFAVSTRIKAAIAQDPQTAHLDIDVEIQGDKAVLQGVVRGIDDIIALQLVASPLPSVAVDVSQVRLGDADYAPPFFPAIGRREPVAQKKPAFRLSALSSPGVAARRGWRNGPSSNGGRARPGTVVPPA
jgi:Cytidylate kinase-like family